MALKQEMLLRLKEDFSLNIYEVKIWTVLLEKGVATAGELADVSGVPRSRCYDVLESLEKKGFIIMKIGKPIKYISIPPEEIIDRVQKEIKEDTSLSLKMFEDIRATEIFGDLELLYKTGIEKHDSQDISTAVTGRDNLNAFIRTLFEKAQKSILIATTEEGFTRKINILNKALKKNKNKLAITIIAPVTEKVQKKVKVKMTIINQDPNTRAIFIDDQEMMFMLHEGKSDKHNDCGVWMESPSCTRAVKKLLFPSN
ncbi:MAG: hypothetical protein O2779_04710 [Nanoarchaeota archaeon]|nr:hypothetical protein [Nanoarchaeota archaeon]